MYVCMYVLESLESDIVNSQVVKSFLHAQGLLYVGITHFVINTPYFVLV